MRALRSAPTPRFRRAARIAGLSMLLSTTCSAPTAWAHGGTTVVEGSSKGVTILVQRAEAQTASGGAAVDLSTILGGPGTGQATVDYWIRSGSGKTFKVETDRDAGGTYHADISTSGRGDAGDWDVSAIVTLGDDQRLRVTTSPGDAPGPDPASTTTSAADEPDGTAPDAAAEAPTSPTLTEGNPPTPTPVLTDDSAPVDDISGQSDGPPGWVFPSLLVLTVIGLAILAVRRRSLMRED